MSYSALIGKPKPITATIIAAEDPDGNVVSLTTDADGNLNVTGGGAGGGDATADNQVLEIAAVNKINAQILDLDTGGGTANTVGLFVALPANGGPVAGGTTTNPFNVVNGFSVKAYDYVSLTQASTTDTYTFKSGGSGGTTVATIVITYTDSTKATLSTVVKS